jgi:hypothetical protein
MVLDRFQSPSDWSGEPSSKNHTLGGKAGTYILPPDFRYQKKQ